MRRIGRLLRYMRPYTVHVVLSVLLMAVVGAMAGVPDSADQADHRQCAERGRVAGPGCCCFRIPNTHRTIDLQSFVPRHFHNAWTVVAVALVGSAIIKSICDYAGTLLTNKAGFGMITDLRNDFYDSMLRRSTAFFQRHTTGMLISTLINDIERVQTAMSTVLSDFLQQVFTLLCMIGAVIVVGGKMAWILLLFVPVIISSARRIGGSVRRRTRRGQDKLAEIQTIVHGDDHGQQHREGVRHGAVGDEALSASGGPPADSEYAVGGGAVGFVATDGCAGGGGDRAAAVCRKRP